MTPEQEIKLLKELLYCIKRSCNNCGKVKCENFQRQRIDCCGLWVSYKDYITDLENKIADIKANCDLAIEGRDIKIMELEKENAELKELLNCNNCSELSEEECEVCAEYSHFKCKRKDLLTKAKEPIRTLISCLIDWVQEGDKDYCYIAEAEQFLEKVK